jgi:hypothetical protein
MSYLTLFAPLTRRKVYMNIIAGSSLVELYSFLFYSMHTYMHTCMHTYIHTYRWSFEKFVDWRQCAAVTQKEAVTVMPSCSGGGSVVEA